MVRLLFRTLDLLPAGLRRWVIRWVLDRIWAHYLDTRVTGLEHIPDGPCLFICNHLSNADAISLWRALRPRTIYFLAGVKLQGTTMTRVASEAVETIQIRPGSADVEALKRAVDTLKHGKSVLIFPEGGRSRTGALIRAKKGASLIARRSGVPVVPMALTGTEKFLPINPAGDMAGEKPRHAVVTVTVGKPFRMDELDLGPAGPEEDERQLQADAMMRRVAELLPEEYRGVYGREKEEFARA